MHFSTLLSLIPLLTLAQARSIAQSESLHHRSPGSFSFGRGVLPNDPEPLHSRDENILGPRKAQFASPGQPVEVIGNGFVAPTGIQPGAVAAEPNPIEALPGQNVAGTAGVAVLATCPPPTIIVKEAVPVIINTLPLAINVNSNQTSNQNSSFSTPGNGFNQTSNGTSSSGQQVLAVCPPQMLVIGEVFQSLALPPQQQIVSLPPSVIINGQTQILTYMPLPAGMSLSQVSVPYNAAQQSQQSQQSQQKPSSSQSQDNSQKTGKSAPGQKSKSGDKSKATSKNNPAQKSQNQ